MPVDIHPKEKVSGVELILTRLHAGGKFSDKSLQLLRRPARRRRLGGQRALEAPRVLGAARRQGIQHQLSSDGRMTRSSRRSARSAQRNTGTTVRFWPDPKFFDSDKFSVPELKHVLKAKAVLCPGLRVTLRPTRRAARRRSGSTPGDLGAYLLEQLGKAERLPPEPITGKHEVGRGRGRVGARLVER
jgi:topoisomerase-4 subunit B